MLTICKSRYFIVPKPGGQGEKVIHEGIQVVSDPMQEAVEGLHPTDGMFDHDTRGGLPPVLLLLLCGQAWIGIVLGFPGFLVKGVPVGTSLKPVPDRFQLPTRHHHCPSGGLRRPRSTRSLRFSFADDSTPLRCTLQIP